MNIIENRLVSHTELQFNFLENTLFERQLINHQLKINPKENRTYLSPSKFRRNRLILIMFLPCLRICVNTVKTKSKHFKKHVKHFKFIEPTLSTNAHFTFTSNYANGPCQKVFHHLMKYNIL